MDQELREETQEPTLENLRKRLNSDIITREVLLEAYRSVACGQRDPVQHPLQPNVIRLACQAMVIIIEGK